MTKPREKQFKIRESVAGMVTHQAYRNACDKAQAWATRNGIDRYTIERTRLNIITICETVKPLAQRKLYLFERLDDTGWFVEVETDDPTLYAAELAFDQGIDPGEVTWCLAIPDPVYDNEEEDFYWQQGWNEAAGKGWEK